MAGHSGRFQLLSRHGNAKTVMDRVLEIQQLRREKRVDFFEQKRIISNSSNSIEDLIEDVEMLDMTKKKDQKWIKLLWSESVSQNFESIVKIAKLVRKKQPIEHGLVVPRLFELLFNAKPSNVTELHLMLSFKKTIAEILTSISLFETIGDCVTSGTIANLVKLLHCETEMDLKSNILFVIGNITSESSSLRDQFIKHGVMKTLQNIIESTIHLKVLSNATWALSNFCFGSDQPPDFSKCSLCIPTLAKLIPHEDFEVVMDSCHALAYLAHGDKRHISNIIASGVCPRLVKLLESSNPEGVTLASLFALGKIALSTEEEIQYILDCGAMNNMKDLLQSINVLIVEDSCSLIGNIAAGSSSDIQAVINSGIIPELLRLVQSEAPPIRLKAAIAIRQCISVRRTQYRQIRFLVSQDCIRILSQQLTSVTDNETLMALLRSLKTILDFRDNGYQQRKNVLDFFKFCSLDQLHQFSSHENAKIRKYSSKLLQHFE